MSTKYECYYDITLECEMLCEYCMSCDIEDCINRCEQSRLELDGTIVP